jgi:transmembrane sensor
MALSGSGAASRVIEVDRTIIQPTAMTDSNPSDDLLARYLADEASRAERDRVEAWAATDPANRRELEQLRAAWKAPGRAEPFDVERAWQRVDARTGGTGKGPTKVVPIASRRPSRVAVLLRVAAVAIVAVGIGLVWQPWRPSELPSAMTYATGVAERRDIDLPDGTRVTLGPATTLRVAAGYNGRERRVDLSGEAWFDIHHDPERPFEVWAGTTVTRDVGTIFSIRAIPGDSVVSVAMVEGYASLRHADLTVADGITLGANAVGVMHASDRLPRVDTSGNVAQLTAWRENRLEFEDASLRDVAAELRRWYAVVVRFDDSTAAARRFTGALPAGDLDEVLRVLGAVSALEISRAADTVIVRR